MRVYLTAIISVISFVVNPPVGDSDDQLGLRLSQDEVDELVIEFGHAAQRLTSVIVFSPYFQSPHY